MISGGHVNHGQAEERRIIRLGEHGVDLVTTGLHSQFFGVGPSDGEQNPIAVA